MKKMNSLGNRILAVMLSIVIMLGMFPSSVFAVISGTLTTDIGEKDFVIGETTEFTFTTVANDDAGAYVLGTFEFSDPSAVEKLEYLEVQTGNWFEFYGDFGPVGTGFPMTDATSHFRVTFNKAGTYTVMAAMVKADDRTVLCSVTETVTVKKVNPGVLTVDIDKKEFTAGQTQEFTLMTTANEDAGTYVLGTFEFSDPSAVEKLEYLEEQTGEWFEFHGEYGPAGTGFPMADAISRFRATFKKAGKYTLTLSMKAVADGTVLCSATNNVKVHAAEQTDFGFETPSPVDQWIGRTFKNEAKGGQSGETIVYEIVEGPATISDDGTVSFTSLGKVTVKATRPGNDFYKAVSATYVVTAIRDVWVPFGFANSNPTVTYQPELSYPNAENKNDLTGWDDAVRFAIVDGDELVLRNDVAKINAYTGVLTILKAGVVTVRATRNADDYYQKASAEYTLTIEKANQSFTFDHEKAVVAGYGLKTFNTQIKGSTYNSGVVTYAVSENTIGATVDPDGVVSFAESVDRVGTVTVIVTMVGDDCYHPFSDSYTITLGYEKTPSTAYTLSGNKTIKGSNWFTGDVTIAAPEGYQISYSNALAGNTWAESVVWKKDGSPAFWAKDANKADAPVVYLKNTETGSITNRIPVSDLYRDASKPTGLSISYDVSIWAMIAEKLFHFSGFDVDVTIKAEDAMSGIGKMEYSLDGGENYTEVSAKDGKYEFKVQAQYRGQLYMRATDTAGNQKVYKKTTDDEKEQILVVDSIAPKVNIEFIGNYQNAVKQDGELPSDRETMSVFDDTTRFIYKDTFTATIEVEETNFFPEDDRVSVRITRDGSDVTDLFDNDSWKLVDGVYTRSYVITGDGDYQLFVDYQDHAQNEMEWTAEEYTKEDGVDKNGTYSYQSNIHTIDTTNPVCEVTYDNNAVIQELDGRGYFDAARTATIKITDRNFRPDEVKFVCEPEIANVASKLTTWDAWCFDGTSWTATVSFADDANYNVTISYHDLANNRMVLKDSGENDYIKAFTVDTTAPTDLKVAYRPKESQFINKILSAITFGYYKATQEVVLTMTDATAGIDYIELTVTPEGPACATDLELPEDLKIWADGSKKSGEMGFVNDIRSEMKDGNLSLTFDIPAQFRGKVSFVAYDRSNNSSNDHEDPGVLVVDTVNPGHTISYNPSNVVNVSDMKDQTDFDAANGITDTGADAYVMYFNTDAVAKIEIREANFDPAQVAIVVQDGKGNAVYGWKQSDWTTTVESGKTDVHTKTVTITEDGDYRIKVFYQDHSMNTPVDYLSKWLVVDKTAPVISVKYSNTDIQNTIGNRNYYSAAQTATVTVKEHNFRADDVVIKVNAKDAVNADVLTLNADGTVKAYADRGADRKNWTAYEAGTWRVKNDTFVITLNYTADANYTFDIEYQDLAKNKAADYTPDLFTVDTTAPKKLTVNYSTSFFEQVKQSITFGYYNAQMTVTITAEDDTSGIYHFAYSYIKGKNVSGVNAQLLDQAIKEAEITYEGKKATATFQIPKMVLGNDNQFNGTVSFTAYDRSENDTHLKDSKVIIVDNISPTSKVTYNAPVQTVDGTSYYAGNIEASVVINEANFDAKDVVVSVTKNGKAFPVDVSWHNNSVDLHTGSFTLTEDGNYIVSVGYQDKSGNRMASYTSNKLTLDATKPTIKVSNIKANSANKDEKYGFVITVEDINLDASAIKPALKAVVQQADGKYATVDVDLGQANVVVKGKTYTYVVENLSDDGLYTLTCGAQDLAANSISQIVLDDGNSYEQVRFSINRNGSVFDYGNKFTSELVGQYYIYNVDEDVVIVEVNVDPVEEYRVTLNGKELVKETDYTTEQTAKDGEWSKRTYTIKKALFEQEGEYSIIVSSTDKAATTAFSDVKNLSMAFVVDRTEPVLVITGLENGGRYRTEAQTVTLIPTDEGGRLSSLTVLVLDSDGTALKDKETGKDISVRFEMSGEELLKYLEENDGKVTFTVPKGLNHQVKIVCNDCALHADDTTNEYSELFRRVTVSENRFVILFSSTPLFVGVVGGLLALVALVIVLIIKSKKKKK